VAKDVTLLIKLNDQASGKINKVTNSTKRLEKAANGAQNSIRRTSKGIRDTGRAADKASKGVNKLGKAIRGLAAGFGVFQAGKFVIFKTAELERQTKSLEVLTGSLGNARSIIKELQQFGAVTPFTSAELIETAKRLKAFGFETEQIVDVTKRLADVAGATGADLGGIATAFGQIQAKGRLQGEELLQLQERGIGLQDELVKMYGFTAEEFRKALEGGRISADAVNVALQNITNTGGKYANGAIAQSETLAGKFSTLIDNITVLAQNIGEVLAPVLKEILSIANNALSSINRLFTSEISRKLSLGRLALLDPGGTLTDLKNLTNTVLSVNVGTMSSEGSVVALSNELKALQRQAEEVGASINRSRVFKVTSEEKEAFEGLQGAIQSQIEALGLRQKLLQEVTKPDTSPIPVPELLKRTQTTTTTTKKSPEQIALEKAEAVNARLVRQAQNRLVTEREIVNNRQEETRHLILAAEKGQEFADFTQRVLDLVKQGISFDEAFKLEKANLDAQRFTAELERQKQFAAEIGQTIEQGITGAIMGAIEGSKSLSESLTGILRQLGGMFLSAGIGSFGTAANPAGSGLLGSLFGKRANGGTVRGGRSYVVGERGPELFTPGRTGSIAPNKAIGGSTSIVVNVDASGTEVQGNQGGADQLGRLIGAAVQAELIKQKRPGGLLTR